MMSRNSTIEPGQPWVTMSGNASGSGERTWRKWTRWPSISVVNCGYWLIRASTRAPVVAAPPVIGERADVRLADAVVAAARQLVGPARLIEPGLEVVEVGLRDVDAEGCDRGVGVVSVISVAPPVRPRPNGTNCSVPL